MAEVILELASVATRAGAKICYGEKIVVDGADVVPVALALYGYGGGSTSPSPQGAEHPTPPGAEHPTPPSAEHHVSPGGAEHHHEHAGHERHQEYQEASGGGGASVSVPVGMLVTRGGAVRFVPNVVALLGVCVPLTFAAGFAASRVLRALR